MVLLPLYQRVNLVTFPPRNCLPRMHTKARCCSCPKCCLLKIVPRLSGADTSWGRRMLTNVGRAPDLRFPMASPLCRRHHLHRGGAQGDTRCHGILFPPPVAAVLPCSQEQCMEEQQHLLSIGETAVVASVPGAAVGSVPLGEWVETRSTLSSSPSAEALGACSTRLNLFRSAGVCTKSEEEKGNVFC